MLNHSRFFGLRQAAVAVLFTLASVASVAAQDTSPRQGQMPGMHGQQGMGGMSGMHANMRAMHVMPATVSAVDAKTGIVDVNAGGMALKVHFPPASVADLKAGDQITLHLGFSKP